MPVGFVALLLSNPDTQGSWAIRELAWHHLTPERTVSKLAKFKHGRERGKGIGYRKRGSFNKQLGEFSLNYLLCFLRHNDI